LNTEVLRSFLLDGLVIPAFPLALHADGAWSERHQRALVRYYFASGAGGLAVGVHSTQFEIRDPSHGLYVPVLELAAEEIDRLSEQSEHVMVKIAGLCGDTNQAVEEAATAQRFGYHAGLLSMAAVSDQSDAAILRHCRQVAETIPIVGFYLQPAVGGRVFPYAFWREFAEIPNVVAIKMAPFNRYQTWDVVRAVIESGRDDVALYTGNDDNIVADLITPFAYRGAHGQVTKRIVGGLLGQWGVWTSKAVNVLNKIRKEGDNPCLDRSWLEYNVSLTDANAALFDAANGFAGCIPGIMEVLRRQKLLPSVRCLNPNEVLSPGQADEIDRICRVYPNLHDDSFVAAQIDGWLS
jgi:dihydrodipicolinate synthase/N-acetylneuraminate lyase